MQSPEYTKLLQIVKKWKMLSIGSLITKTNWSINFVFEVARYNT